MIKDIVDYSSGFAIETGFPLSSKAATFPAYLRQKTGILETYSLFAFPEDRYPEADFLKIYLPVVPTLMEYIDNLNDLMSFYKEARDEELFTFVCTYAHT